ncbi:MAG: serine/threonine-protein kinase [Gemmatales bacterium]
MSSPPTRVNKPDDDKADPHTDHDTLRSNDAKSTAMFENAGKDTATPEAPKPESHKPTNSMDAYNLLRNGTQPVTIGDFTVMKKLGQGGMGAVFKAKQLSLDREVALKVLARHLADDEKFVSRFEREARVMAKLDHGNIIRCYHIGKELGLHYLAMEYVDGCSLQDLIDKNGKLSVADALYVALRVADALQYAHELNMVHRDIKPDNVLISKKGVVKVADLGLAKPVNDDLSMTASGVGAGTPHYMAPEQMRSAKDVDGRADIYALGAMMYVMLTGKKPFDGETLVRLLEQKEKGRLEPARKLNPKVPDKLDLMIEKMMTKSLTARYQTCAEVMRDLEGLGLAGDYLSVMFPDGPPAGATAGGSRSGYTSSRSSGNVNINPPASASTSRIPPRESDPGSGDIWYLAAGTTADGKKKVRKLTQAQMKDLIKAKQLDSTAEASRQAGSGYRALATFKEFEQLFRSQVAQRKLEKKTEKMADKFAEIAAEVESYERRKWWSRFLHSVGGWVFFLIGLAILVAIGIAIWYFFPDIMNMFAKKVGAV